MGGLLRFDQRRSSSGLVFPDTFDSHLRETVYAEEEKHALPKEKKLFK
jgi:hypothetical protein